MPLLDFYKYFFEDCEPSCSRCIFNTTDHFYDDWTRTAEYLAPEPGIAVGANMILNSVYQGISISLSERGEASKVFFSLEHASKGSRKKSYSFFKFRWPKLQRPLSSKGGGVKALMARPLKKNFFCGFSK